MSKYHSDSFVSAAAEYWRGYSTSRESQEAYIRNWTPETLSNGMIERAMRLLDACVEAESDSEVPKSYSRDGEVVYSTETRIWGSLKLCLLAVDNHQEALPNNLAELVQKGSENALCLCILPSSYIIKWQDFANSVRSQGLFLLPVFPVDLNYLADGHWTLADMVDFKLFRIGFFGKLDVESQYSEGILHELRKSSSSRTLPILFDLEKIVERLDERPTSWADHPKVDRLTQILHSGNDCVLVGPSSSGKSVLAFQAGLKLVAMGTSVKFTDVGILSSSDIYQSLAQFRKEALSKKNTLLILDNLQGSPSVAQYLFLVTKLLRRAGTAGNLTMLGITWPSFAKETTREFPKAVTVDVDPFDAQRAISSKNVVALLSAERLAEMQQIARGDVLLWKLLQEMPSGAVLSRKELANRVWSRRIRKFHGNLAAAKRATYVASVLGRYEFDVSDGFLQFHADVTKLSLDQMIRGGVLRRTRDKISVGHASLCALLSDWIHSEEATLSDLRDSGKPTRPADIIESYIRSSDPSDVWAILRKLSAQVGFKSGLGLSDRAQILADAWKSIDSLMERIEQQQTTDPTWNSSLANAFFAIEALSSVGKNETAKQTVDFMRTKWTVSDGRVRILDGTIERLDFDQIREAMKQEDEELGVSESNQSRAEKIDFDKFHHTWVMGLVLGAEAAYGQKSQSELEELAVAVEKEQDQDQWFFYPARVPWCTARVLIGLARCGRSCANSLPVKKACDWLLRPVKEGGPYQGIWESGTGKWNTDLETTSMCIMALTSAGISTSDSRLTAALSYVTEKRKEWDKRGREMDGVNAILAYLAMMGSWKEIVPQVQNLSKWARGDAVWSSSRKTANETFKQSCLAATVAAYLIEAVWFNLRTDLQGFLDTFAISGAIATPAEETVAPRAELGFGDAMNHVRERLALRNYKVIPKERRPNLEFDLVEEKGKFGSSNLAVCDGKVSAVDRETLHEFREKVRSAKENENTLTDAILVCIAGLTDDARETGQELLKDSKVRFHILCRNEDLKQLDLL